MTPTWRRRRQESEEEIPPAEIPPAPVLFCCVLLLDEVNSAGTVYQGERSHLSTAMLEPLFSLT